MSTLSQYPILARPVLNQVSFEEHRAITGRLYSKILLRKNKIKPHV